MRAITVQQPWAWAIVHGGKNVENRTRIGTWRGLVGRDVAIHAGARWSDRGGRSPIVGAALSALTLASPADPRFTMGAIIGLVRVVDVHPEQGDCCRPWGEQSYVEHGGTKRVDIVHLVLENACSILPIECPGKLGAWTIPDHVMDALRLDEVPNA